MINDTKMSDVTKVRTCNNVVLFVKQPSRYTYCTSKMSMRPLLKSSCCFRSCICCCARRIKYVVIRSKIRGKVQSLTAMGTCLRGACVVFKRIGKSVIRVSPTTGNSIRKDLPIGAVWPKNFKDKTDCYYLKWPQTINS